MGRVAEKPRTRTHRKTQEIPRLTRADAGAPPSRRRLLAQGPAPLRIPEERRVYQLGFGVHSLVARKQPREQKQ